MVCAVASPHTLYSPSKLRELDHWDILFTEIPAADKARIEKNLVKDGKKMEQVHNALLCCNWQNPVFLDEDITLTLLTLFKDKWISNTVFATAMYYVYLIEIYGANGVQVVELFPLGIPNRNAINLIKLSMLDGSQYLYGNAANAEKELQDHQLTDLLLLMTGDDVHPCEQVMFYTRDHDGVPLPGQKLRTITQEIQARVGFNFFGRVNGHILHASAKLYEVFLSTKFGEKETVCSIYLFAMPYEETLLRWQLKNVRIKTIPAPKLNLKQYPSEVDCYVARGLDPTKHDDYHQYRCSCVFKEHRPLFTALAMQYNQTKVAKNLGTLAHKILFRLNGLELLTYPREKRGKKDSTKDSKVFWYSLRDTINTILEKDAEKLKDPDRVKSYKTDLNWLIICIARTFLLYGSEIKSAFKVKFKLSEDNSEVLSKPFFKQIKFTMDQLKDKIKPLSNDNRSLIERIISPWWQNKH